ncbi:MAG: pilus assembly protein N-terminal domain-containing protein [Planctomycetes bacterium]|nr:pilus assembly protein N-terminal domain-containing protein [Planctomycetota bacterium]
MKCLAFTDRSSASSLCLIFCRRAVIAALAILAMGSRGKADEPVPTRIVANPATTVRFVEPSTDVVSGGESLPLASTASPVQQPGPEVWVSSTDEGVPDKGAELIQVTAADTPSASPAAALEPRTPETAPARLKFDVGPAVAADQSHSPTLTTLRPVVRPSSPTTVPTMREQAPMIVASEPATPKPETPKPETMVIRLPQAVQPQIVRPELLRSRPRMSLDIAPQPVLPKIVTSVPTAPRTDAASVPEPKPNAPVLVATAPAKPANIAPKPALPKLAEPKPRVPVFVATAPAKPANIAPKPALPKPTESITVGPALVMSEPIERTRVPTSPSFGGSDTRKGENGWNPFARTGTEDRAVDLVRAVPARQLQVPLTTQPEALPRDRSPLPALVSSQGAPPMVATRPAPRPVVEEVRQDAWQSSNAVFRTVSAPSSQNGPRAERRVALLQPQPITPPAALPPTRLGPFEVLDHTDELAVVLRRSKLLRTQVDVYRTAVVDPSVCDVVQFTPREISVIGRSQGATHVTFWFEDDTHRPVTYLVRVVPDPEVSERREQQYDILEEILAELFPESKVSLTPVADKLIVRGQARDAAEAAQILAVIRGQAVMGGRGSGHLVDGTAVDPLRREETNQQLPATQVINMLRIPGAQQVALRVKIAELNRSAARQFGVNIDLKFDLNDGYLLLQTLLNQATGNSAASVLGSFDGDQLNFGIHYLEQHGVVRLLSEPTLVTLSGRPATFVAGGEIAVPTTVGVGGAAAITTDFRAYGAIISFLPVVLDKDLIRLEVSPEFSQLDNDTSSGGIPGMKTRAVTTTVEMREGQTLAIAGLLEDTMKGDNTGNVPFIAELLGKREVTRNENELIILVTPELIHPMDPETVPPLPGFDVTEPTNKEFFLKGRIEGRPVHEYRSTVWPRLRRRYQAGGPAMISGPFGHGD